MRQHTQMRLTNWSPESISCRKRKKLVDKDWLRKNEYDIYLTVSTKNRKYSHFYIWFIAKPYSLWSSWYDRVHKKDYVDDVNIRSGTLSQITLKVAYLDFVCKDLYNNIYDLRVLQCLSRALNKPESCLNLTLNEVQM